MPRPALAWLLLAATGTAAFALHEDVAARRDAFPPEVDISYVPPAAQLRWMSLGYREALADLLWVRALVFSGANLGSTDIVATDRYVEAITGLSPRFARVYTWGGITAVYAGTGKITRDQVERAIRIYRRGLEEFPEDHEILYPFGMLLTHQVSSTEGYTEEEKAALAEEGVEMIRLAAAFGADPLVRRYAATLVSERAGDQLAIQFLESQLAQTEDEKHRRLLRLKLSQLAGHDTVEAIERTREEFFAELKEHAPYVPDTLWAVIRPEPGPLEGVEPAR
jgi:hypothetical protein